MRRNEEGLKVAKLRPQILIKGIFWYKIYIRVPLSGGFWSGRGLVSNYRLKSTCTDNAFVDRFGTTDLKQISIGKSCPL